MSPPKNDIVLFREATADLMNYCYKHGRASKAAGLDHRFVADTDPRPKDGFEAMIPELKKRRGRISHLTEQLEAELSGVKKIRL